MAYGLKASSCDPLRGYCTPNQKLACFVLYLKSFQHFEKWYTSKYSKLSKELKKKALKFKYTERFLSYWSVWSKQYFDYFDP